MIGTLQEKTTGLLHKGVEAANANSKHLARAYFQDVLSLEPHNEMAILWLAYLADNPYSAMELLTGLLQRNPKNEIAQGYLAQAQARCEELDSLISGSYTYQSWDYVRGSKKPVVKKTADIPVFGEYLLRQGIITQQQLNIALDRHQDLANRGAKKQVGQVMVELGYISQPQLEGWLQQQRGEYIYRFQD